MLSSYLSAPASQRLARVCTLLFVLAFFAYLFGPLIVMGLSAFNSSAFPRVAPWDCFSVEWFDVLANDADLIGGLQNSIIIACGVVIVAVPLGLAGALMLTQTSSRLRPWYYTITISPILIPGVVLGISTLVFWDRLGRMFNAGYDSFFYDGIFLTIAGQSTFVSAYAMLIFISRLQRFDAVQEEAALDLGATHVQTFRKILLPFLAPAIASAAVLGFLASFENYNTTVFTILNESTITTVLASKVRYGINPSISALAVVIIALTLIAAVYYEILKRREEKYQREVAAAAKHGGAEARVAKAGLLASPAMWLVTAVFIAGLGTLYFAGSIGVEECKTELQAQKAAETERKVREFRMRQLFQQAAPGVLEAPSPAESTTQDGDGGAGGFGGAFAPQNLTGDGAAGGGDATGDAGNDGAGGGLFAPQNLQPQSGDAADDAAGGGAGGAFAPQNLFQSAPQQ